MPKGILTPQERRQRHRQQMINDILEISRAIMREHGAAALNLHEIARQMGIKTPSLYAYFPSKRAIYDALFRLGVRLFRERLEQAMNENAPAWDRFRAATAAYMSFAQGNPELFHVIFERTVPGFEPSEESRAESRAAFQAMRNGFGRIVDSGDIDPHLPPEAAHDLMFALMHGLTALHLAHEPHLPVGSSRFGSLIPPAIEVFQTAWGSDHPAASSKPAQSPASTSPFVWETP